ncbi:MAG: nuclear transport factor 2 family protein [Patulibacter minatonensis]
MHAFRAAVEAKSIEAMSATLADDVTFLSPVAFAPYRGRELVTAILGRVLVVLEDFTYVREIGAGGDDGLVLVFTATTDGKQVHGADFLSFDADGRISELAVMLRPLSAGQAVAARMAVEFDAVKAELGL